jgi:long-chain acyl-CoA synthetase
MLCHIAIWGLVDENTPGSFRTLDEIFAEGLKVGADTPFLGARHIISRDPLKYAPVYSWITYGQADMRRRYIGSALHSLFQKGELGAGEYPTVGIWSQNRPGLHISLILCPDADPSDLEWQLIDIAAASYQKVSVSLYDTLGTDSVGEWTLNNLSEGT